ncbi:MAG: hypothetical protein QOE51_1069, partial [Actinoplanes sp.]|nr:hypothetical protein [Actinoplanes sp.]
TSPRGEYAPPPAKPYTGILTPFGLIKEDGRRI